MLYFQIRFPVFRQSIKLVYQNEFGGGHLISDPEQSLAFLRREYTSVAHDPLLSLVEEIGNGVVRINLAALDTDQLSLERLNSIFVQSARMHRGERKSFLKKLYSIRDVSFHFPVEDLDRYLEKYRAEGYPMVSHSEAYRVAYKPAYCVVLRELLP